ncbi:MAG: M23 family metallopeptidase [Candidatus Moranbacteria bacterium]|nr:M23 family metallopeptidase [Candidatus Moranbacteria bacterium]
MKKLLTIAVIATLVLCLFWIGNLYPKKSAIAPVTNQLENADVANLVEKNAGSQETDNVDIFQPPLDRAGERVSKKPFEIFITPQNSPIQPEKFRGYHTGADFEIFPEESDADVPVRAVCPGRLKAKEYANGYGGVAVESCELNGQPITAVYGHLKLASIRLVVGSDLKSGDIIGVLGTAYSAETSGERKHLHLGFHKGTSMNILGYVQSQSELSGWIDPCLYVCYD